MPAATEQPAKTKRATPRLSLPLSECESVSPSEWCALHRIGRTTLYQMWKDGTGPEYFLVGSRRRIPKGARPQQPPAQGTTQQGLGEAA